MAGYGQEKDGDIGVIACGSRRIKPSEFSLSMFHLELLPIVFLRGHFADYLLVKVATVHTGIKSITELRTIRNVDSRTTHFC